MNRVLNFAVASASALIMANTRVDAAVINITAGSTSGYTMTDGNTYVVQNSVSFSNSTAGGSGMSVADNATVVLYVPAGITLTATGANGSGRTGGGAGIRVPETATLVITGEGTVNATGGNAGNGGNGADGSKGTEPSVRYGSNPSGGGGVYGFWGKGSSGAGGVGGAGGGGAGAAIGGDGSIGGSGGNGANARNISSYAIMVNFNGNGNGGSSGSNGSDGTGMGECYLIGAVNMVVKGGGSGNAGKAGNFADYICTFHNSSTDFYAATCGGGGGGGGGAGKSPSCAIGGGGSSGGGGGGGGSGATAARDADYDYKYEKYPLTNAHGGGGSGGASNIASGKTGSAKEKTWGGHYSWIVVRSSDDKYYYYGGNGGSGGAAGAEGGAGTLYVAPTATVNVEREKLEATTHPAAQYTITFDVNGGKFSSPATALTATLGCELPDCIQSPKREGYSFGGWVTLAGEKYYEASGAKSISSYPEASDVRLYAKWRLNDDYTVTTTEAVPYSYLDMNCPALLAEHGGDYEVAAKATAANGRNKVWECYVAGISPTDIAAKFTAKIEMKDGNPVITWEPNLNADGAVVRIYKVYGSETLENGGDWQSPTNSLHRFFKVGVEMP